MIDKTDGLKLEVEEEGYASRVLTVRRRWVWFGLWHKIIFCLLIMRAVIIYIGGVRRETWGLAVTKAVYFLVG